MSRDIFDEEVTASCKPRRPIKDPCATVPKDPCQDIRPTPPVHDPCQDPYYTDPCYDPRLDPIYDDPCRRPSYGYDNPDHYDNNYYDNNYYDNNYDNNNFNNNLDDTIAVPPGWRRPAGGWRFFPRPTQPPSGAIIPGTPAYPPETELAPVAPGVPAMPGAPGTLPIEESYVENILRLNRGKLATIYATYENNMRWNAKIFRGCIEAAGRDHIIISDPKTGKRYLLLMLNVDYITFDEEIAYEYPFNGVRTFPR
ncbi:spore coat protein GerQ [Heliorestis acidaminivorans]|uniref:Spore coat protein GerQ n=1 Tax=Heliorestis acidaminivorans TaxID=553427 RepID=A0A6I0EW58_9FIRM|nr:spore coat protein GerQ [Heliorestis acidaminivorans]KAB2951298.1 spore coat protein GerQ [Heliorestis acidaminivorans]